MNVTGFYGTPYRSDDGKRRGRKRRLLLFAILTAAFLLLFGVFFYSIGRAASSVPGSDSAERWTGEGSDYPYAALSLYMDDDHALSLNTIYQKRVSLEKKLVENSVDGSSTSAGNAVATDEEETEETVQRSADARTYIDCFSSETALTVSTERASVEVTATAAGGDFFFFHPLTLINGSYFAEGDELTNTIVLDEYAAWNLFGATEVAGLEVTLYNQPFVVTGVIKSPTDKTEKEAWGEKPRVFVNYKGLRNVSGYDSITAYEAVLPNPIKQFAENMMEELFGVSADDQGMVLYDGTNRFGYIVLLKQIPDFFHRLMKTDRVVPPYWENTARVAEGKAVIYALFSLIFLILAAVFLTAALGTFFCLYPIRVKKIYEFFDNKVDKLRMKQWKKKMAQKEREV